MKDVNDYEMMLDVNAAFDYWKDQNKKEFKATKKKFLKLCGMSAQTAHNYQTRLSPQKILQYAEILEEVSGLPKQQFIKRIKE